MTQEAIPFDTHRFVRNLVASGSTEKQAEALADEQITLLNSNLATKADIASVQADINVVRAEVEDLRLSSKADFEALRLSTKTDFESLQLSTKSDTEALRLSIDAKIEAAKFDLLKWMIAAMVAQSALTVSLSVTLSKLL